MSDFSPLPPKHKNSSQTWGEAELIKITKEQGYTYFVVYGNPRLGYNRSSELARRDQVMSWLEDHQIDYNWVGGRASYEFAFRTEEDAVLFKLAWGK